MRAMRERIENPPSEKIKAALEELISPIPCPACEAAGCSPRAWPFSVNGLGIADYTMLPISDSSQKV